MIGRPIATTIGILAVVCSICPGQTTDAVARAIMQHAGRRWKLIRQVTATFDTHAGPASILLLESPEVTGEGGALQPLNDVDLLVIQAKKVVYDYVKSGVMPPDYNGTRYYMDDGLEIRDVTGDSVPEILFHSGTEGASDHLVREHVLKYDRARASFTDVAPPPFYHSGTHGLMWLEVRGRGTAVIADRNWPRKTPADERCHYCESPFRYAAWRWDDGRRAFVAGRTVYGRKKYEEVSSALEDERPLIESALAR
jgi:hypothetical protein